MKIRLLALVTAFVAVVACGGGSAPQKSGNGYEEYECPPPIGRIVREDCSRSALQYDGAHFSGSVGAGGVGASAEYKQTAVREADSLVSMLKEQRVGLCNNFNTCKLTVAEYREEQKGLDDSFVALLALKDKMAQLDAQGAAKLLEEIQRLRLSVRGARTATPAEKASPPAAAAPPSNACVGFGSEAETCRYETVGFAYTCKCPGFKGCRFKRYADKGCTMCNPHGCGFFSANGGTYGPIGDDPRPVSCTCANE